MARLIALAIGILAAAALWLVHPVAALTALAAAAIAAIWFLNRFYQKASRETALVRTGYGGKRVVLDGGCLVLPFLHQVAQVNMKTLRLEISREGRQSLITQDRLRVDLAVEFYLRVRPDAEGVATAAQALAGKTFRAPELQEIIEGKLIDAMQSVVAQLSMDELHEQRAQFVRKVKDTVSSSLAFNGLDLESVSLTALDQTPFKALEENNAFNAVGMRRLAEVIAANKKQRAVIEADADIAVRQSQLEASKRKLIIEREQEQAQIEQRLEIETLKAEQNAQLAEHKAASERRAEAARIGKEQEVRLADIDKDRRLRELQLNTRLALDIAERQNQIDLARKTAEVAAAEAESSQARAAAAAAAEAVQTEKDKAIAERARQVALIRAQEQAEVDARRTQSAAGTVRSQAEAEADAQRARAQAESDAITLRAQAKQNDLQAEAEGRKALALADNSLSEAIINMRIEQHKLDTLPELVAQMVKPVEKIEGIRINQISGLGGFSSAGHGGGNNDKALVNQALDGLMGMAVQLPVLQKLGRELGINLEQGLAGIGDDEKNSSADEKS